MNYLINGIVCAAITLLALAGMLRGWRARSAAASKLQAAPLPAGDPLKKYDDVLYAVTNTAGNKFERVSLPGLKYRGYSQVTVYEDAITVQVRGEQPVAMRELQNVTLGRNSLAKAVEAGGLVIVSWRLDSQDLESVLRFNSAAEQASFISDVQATIARCRA